VQRGLAGQLEIGRHGTAFSAVSLEF
jgi:hypothetical protein